MTPSKTVYFGYGSNLWLRQMSLRCPESKFMGVGMLSGWRLQINERGYCNVVETPAPSATSATATVGTVLEPGNVVFGHVYSLMGQDEDELDRNEGVPFAYTKEIMTVNFWASKDYKPVDVKSEPERMQMLVYVDRRRTEDSKPKTEYIYRMNMGIADALEMGVPQDYVDNVVRKFIPTDVTLNDDEKEEAENQANGFKERG